MSAVIAAEAMRRLPRNRDYGPYPRNTRFGDFRISAEEDLAELVADDAFLYAGSTRSVPPDPAALRRRWKTVRGPPPYVSLSTPHGHGQETTECALA